MSSTGIPLQVDYKYLGLGHVVWAVSIPKALMPITTSGGFHRSLGNGHDSIVPPTPLVPECILRIHI